MWFHKIMRTSVGAGSPRPSPIYRPSLDVRSPDENVKTHYNTLAHASLKI
jgi:hypothetical protein